MFSGAERFWKMRSRDQQTKGIIEFNEMISKQKNIENIILPLRDGVMLIRKIE